MTTTIRGAVLAADHEHRIDAHLEQRGDYVPHDPITLVLEAVPARANGSKNPRLAPRGWFAIEAINSSPESAAAP